MRWDQQERGPLVQAPRFQNQTGPKRMTQTGPGATIGVDSLKPPQRSRGKQLRGRLSCSWTTSPEPHLLPSPQHLASFPNSLLCLHLLRRQNKTQSAPRDPLGSAARTRTEGGGHGLRLQHRHEVHLVVRLQHGLDPCQGLVAELAVVHRHHHHALLRPLVAALHRLRPQLPQLLPGGVSVLRAHHHHGAVHVVHLSSPHPADAWKRRVGRFAKSVVVQNSSQRGRKSSEVSVVRSSCSVCK